VSVAGLVVGEPGPPPLAVMPVKDGMEKNTPAQANGALVPMAAPFVKVTVSGLFA
jgi:hypothetical protein